MMMMITDRGKQLVPSPTSQNRMLGSMEKNTDEVMIIMIQEVMGSER